MPAWADLRAPEKVSCARPHSRGRPETRTPVRPQRSGPDRRSPLSLFLGLTAETACGHEVGALRLSVVTWLPQ